MVFMGLTRTEKTKLERDVVSNDARLKLTRLARRAIRSDEANVELINRNQFVNIGRTVLGLPIYTLQPDDDGLYMSEEFGWHMAELELVMRRPDTAQLVEMLGDMLQLGMLDVQEVNEILAGDNSSVRFRARGFHDDISVKILSEAQMDEEGDDQEHPNIRVLMGRLDSAFEDKDYAGVLHTSATIFETLAKLVFSNPKVEGETLGSIFEGYRKRSGLPDPVLEFVLDTYKRRNVEPLAGHGATRAPTVTAKEAVTLVEMTKMCVRLERRIALQEVDAVPPSLARRPTDHAGSLPVAPKAEPGSGSTKPKRLKLKRAKPEASKAKALKSKKAKKTS